MYNFSREDSLLRNRSTFAYRVLVREIFLFLSAVREIFASYSAGRPSSSSSDIMRKDLNSFKL